MAKKTQAVFTQEQEAAPIQDPLVNGDTLGAHSSLRLWDGQSWDISLKSYSALTFPHAQALQCGQCWGCFQPGQAREASQLCRGCSEQSVPPGAGSPRFAYRCVGNPGGPWRQGGWRRWHGQRGEAGQPAAPKISRLGGGQVARQRPSARLSPQALQWGAGCSPPCSTILPRLSASSPLPDASLVPPLTLFISLFSCFSPTCRGS